MKDKSRFVSSVIVSLLAGFIYYNFGDDINEKFQSSFKAVLSSNDDVEIYLRADYQPFNSLTNNTQSTDSKKKSKFYIKRKSTIDLKKNDVTVRGDELFSEFVKASAKVNKPTPDKNIDFTAELNRLLKSDSSPEPVAGKEFRIDKSFSSSNEEVADVNYKSRSLLHKDKENILGNGFEYNFMIEEIDIQKEENETQGYYEKSKLKETHKVKVECRTNGVNQKTIKVIIPKVLIKSDCNNHSCPEALETEGEAVETDSESYETEFESESVEVDVPVESCGDDSM